MATSPNRSADQTVKVTSILSNPDQDPHLFEASPSVARNLSGAQIVIYSGIDYDPWMADLLKASKAPDRKVIVVADLIGKKSGDNPHIWYDPATMVAAAQAIKDALVAADPANKAEYEKRLTAFEDSIKPIQDKIAALRKRSAGVPATATEPVFGYMFEALGMEVRNGDFQLAVMNDTEPTPSQIAAFEDDLKTTRSSCSSTTAKPLIRWRSGCSSWRRHRIFRWSEPMKPNLRVRPIRHG